MSVCVSAVFILLGHVSSVFVRNHRLLNCFLAFCSPMPSAASGGYSNQSCLFICQLMGSSVYHNAYLLLTGVHIAEACFCNFGLHFLDAVTISTTLSLAMGKAIQFICLYICTTTWETLTVELWPLKHWHVCGLNGCQFVKRDRRRGSASLLSACHLVY